MLCASCLADIPTGLTFADNPPCAYFRGEALDLPRGLLAILRQLAVTGQAPFARLHASRDCISVQIHNLRKRLPEGITIHPIKGWGYELRIAEGGK